MKNRLLLGDNIEQLNTIDNGSVDLIYLDPPFASGEDHHQTVIGSEAQQVAYRDSWFWEGSARNKYDELKKDYPDHRALLLLKGLEFMTAEPRAPLFAYLAWMTPRLIEMQKKLSDRGCLWLHCDTTASHYLKVLLDNVFPHPNCFKGDITWKRTFNTSNARRPAPVHDTLLFYTNSPSNNYTWNPTYHKREKAPTNLRTDPDGNQWYPVDLTGSGTRYGHSGRPWNDVDPSAQGRHWAVAGYIKEEYTERTGQTIDGTTQDWLDALYGEGMVIISANNRASYKRFYDPMKGVALQDIWTDIDRLSSTSNERVSFSTQKPIALLTRIIECSSSPGDMVLDPFLGSGTTAVAAQRLNRNWIGIELTSETCDKASNRLFEEFGTAWEDALSFPPDAKDLRRLADADPNQFERWVMYRLGGRHTGKVGDKGVDGILTVALKSGSRSVVVSVKKTADAADLRALVGTWKEDCYEEPLARVLVALDGINENTRRTAWRHGKFEITEEEDDRFAGKQYQRVQVIKAEDFFNQNMELGGLDLPGYADKQSRLAKQIALRDNFRRDCENSSFLLKAALESTDDEEDDDWLASVKAKG